MDRGEELIDSILNKLKIWAKSEQKITNWENAE
jgi:hypothetical protein